MENYKELYDVACFLAKVAHKNQLDKAGKPYIGHLERVSGTFNEYTYKIIAILHDSLEDTWITEDLLRHLFPEKIVDAVVFLTRKENESYKEFIERMCYPTVEQAESAYMAREVKIADLTDNMNLGRLEKITDKDIERVKKYNKWRTFLIERQQIFF